jgi:hypothetical protein
MNNSRAIGLLTLVVFILVLSSYAWAQKAQGADNAQSLLNVTDSDKDGIQDVAEMTLGTNPYNADTDGDGIADKQDSDPTFADKPAIPSGGDKGFKINQAIVENNFDPVTKTAVADHLELTVRSIAEQDISNMSAYYTTTDVLSGKMEGYIVHLNHFVLKAHETQIIHFDKQTKLSVSDPLSGHFGVANPNGIYYTSKNKLIFDLTLWSNGYSAESVQITKDAAGAEGAETTN